MRSTPSLATLLIILTAALAVIASIAVVLATSPQSFELAFPNRFAGRPSPTVAQLENVQATLTLTNRPDLFTLTLTPAPPVQETRGTARFTATSTTRPTQTATPFSNATPGPTPLPTLPPDVRALAIVALEDGVAARLRDAPAGNILAAVLGGAHVQILQGHEVVDDIVWIQIRDEAGQTGWMAESLLGVISTP